MALPVQPPESASQIELKRYDNPELGTFTAQVSIQGFEEVITIPEFHALNVADQLAPTEVAKHEALKLWLKNNSYPDVLKDLSEVEKQREMKRRMTVTLIPINPNAKTQ